MRETSRSGRSGNSSELNSGESGRSCSSDGGRDPLGAGHRVRAPAGEAGRGQGVEHGTGVADQELLYRQRPGAVQRIDVDLDDGLAGRVDQRRDLVDRVQRAQPGPHRDEQVRLADQCVGAFPPPLTEHAAAQGVGLGVGSLAALGGDHRRVGRVGEGQQAVVGPAHPHAVAGDDDGPLRLADRLGRVGDRGRVRRRGQFLDVPVGVVDARERVGSHAALEGGRVIDHGDRPGVPGQRVLDGQLGLLDGLGRVVADEHRLADRLERRDRVVHAVLAGAGMVVAVVAHPAAVEHLGQDHHAASCRAATR